TFPHGATTHESPPAPPPSLLLALRDGPIRRPLTYRCLRESARRSEVADRPDRRVDTRRPDIPSPPQQPFGSQRATGGKVPACRRRPAESCSPNTPAFRT